MSRNIYVCFTCLRDSALLPIHYEALQRAVPGAPVYYVYDKPEAGQATVPSGAFKVQAEFPRNGNLLGLECHLGMLKTMQFLARRHPQANVVKIDSDVFLLSDYFLSPLGTEHDMVGVAPAKSYYCKGTCYGMTTGIIDKVIHYLSNGYQDRSGRLEDSVISMVAAIVSDAHKVRIHNAANADNTDILYTIFHKGIMESPDFLDNVRGFLDCGDPLYTNDYPDATAAKVNAMQFVLQHFRKQ